MKRDINKKINGFYVYCYQFLDDLEFLRKPDRFTADGPDAREGHCSECEMRRVKKAFRAAGWEGDGELLTMWIPPFVSETFDENFGCYAWVVKQNNNGMSFIASRQILPFPKLIEQN